MSTEHDAAPAVSDEASRLIDGLIQLVRNWKDHTEADRALTAYVAGLEAEVVRLRDALEPFARADRAIGLEPGPFRFETANGHRLIEREHLRAAALATQEPPHAP